MVVLQIAFYISILVLLAGTLLKTFKISQMPVHLRWDLYPIPHEKKKAHYGGSYFEEPNWWTKPYKRSLIEEAVEMAKEIFGIKSLYRNNRGLWYFSYPFHIGLYLLTGLIILLIVGAILESAGIGVSSLAQNQIGRFVYLITIPFGALGWILGAFGAIGLLVTRIVKSKYRRYSTRADYFNLILFFSLFASGLYSWLAADNSFTALRAFTQSLLTFKTSPGFDMRIKVELSLTAIFFFYLPFTHMTHFIGKFFTYHRVRWQDEPSHRGNGIEQDVIEALEEIPDWSAPHMQAGKTWVEAASEDDLREADK